ncbi:MAG: DUF4445 domain-containing protein [Gammaproteobacteria bacterium]|nr:DUF4445 domain-containing protein [Gammaproteobacteria bacterium]
MTETSETALIVFTPSGKRGTFPIGTNILDAARSLGVDLDSVCGGRGLCGRCQIQHAVGEFSKHNINSNPEHVSDTTKAEARYQRINGEFSNQRRLGCQATMQGDLVVDIPPESQVHRQVVRKEVDHVHIDINPKVRLHVVEVQEPDMHDPSGDLRRLRQALSDEWQLDNLRVDLPLVQSLQNTLRAGQWQVTAAVYADSELISLWPGYKESVYGVAIDVGSTTIAAHLSDLVTGDVLASSGSMNPQIRFGEDLMSRVSYVMMNPGGEAELTTAVRDAINDLISSVATEAGIDPLDVVELTFVANPVMHHLLLGINPVELGGAPFALAVDEALTVNARQLDLNINSGGKAYLLPCVAGHVGADSAAVVLAEQPQSLDAWTLLVDVGTNAEIVLGNSQRVVACSSPTGPAFEGAQISGGQRAAPGAIERVRIDPDTLEPRFRVIGSELWSNELGFDTSIESIGVTGICGSGIIEVVAEMFLTGIIDSDGVIQGTLSDKSTRIEANDRTFSYRLYDGDISIRITQNDVRQIQLAKAALYAGVRLLMDRLEINQVDRIRLAGAFGSHIDVKYAMILGLIPDCDLNHVSSAGNAAGTGARIALLNKESRSTIEKQVRDIEKVETAVEPQFQLHFVEAMAFPHKTADFVELAKVVNLPAKTTAANDAGGGRRARAARRRSKRT